MMELGATVCRAREAACRTCPVARWCASRGQVEIAPRAAAGARERFEDTNRWVRGRVIAALAAGEALPAGIDEQRLRRALDGLTREGLVTGGGEGARLA